MSPEAGSFAAFYASPWHHPWLLWAATAVAIAAVLARRRLAPSLRRYCVALGLLSLVDAWLTSSSVPGLGKLSEPLASTLPLLFVLAGDFRYLLLWSAATPGGALALRPWGLAQTAGLALIVPILSQLLFAALPFQDEPRVLFLIYEVAFFALTAALLRGHPRALTVPWLRSVSHFVMLYYGLWAAADLLLLASGADLGFALRVVPNLLYYAGLVAAIAWLAPPLRIS